MRKRESDEMRKRAREREKGGGGEKLLPRSLALRSFPIILLLDRIIQKKKKKKFNMYYN